MRRDLIKNIKEIDENNFNSKTEFISQPRLINLEQKLTLRDAFYSPKEDVDFYKAEVNKTDNRASNPASLTVNLFHRVK